MIARKAINLDGSVGSIRSLIKLFRQMSWRQRNQVSIWSSGIFLLISFGLTFLLVPEEPVRYAELIARIGVVQSEPRSIDADRVYCFLSRSFGGVQRWSAYLCKAVCQEK